MALSATVDVNANPPKLTVTSDDREFTVTVTSAFTNEEATATGTWPLTVSDSSGHTWTEQSDDGTTAVYTY